MCDNSMVLNEKEININDLIENIYNDKNFIKMRGNGIYLSDNWLQVLLRYNIDYKKYSSLKSLLFEIEDILNNNPDADDLEEVSTRLSEINYYNNTNK